MDADDVCREQEGWGKGGQGGWQDAGVLIMCVQLAHIPHGVKELQLDVSHMACICTILIQGQPLAKQKS